MEHLPECPILKPCDGQLEHEQRDMPTWCQACDARCQCDMLRECTERVRSERISEWDRGSGTYYRALEAVCENLTATRGLCAGTDPNRFGLALAIATVEAMIDEFTGVMLDG